MKIIVFVKHSLKGIRRASGGMKGNINSFFFSLLPDLWQTFFFINEYYFYEINYLRKTLKIQFDLYCFNSIYF